MLRPLALLLALAAQAAGFALPRQSSQLVLGLATDWNASRATLQRYQRSHATAWQPVGTPVPARLGRDGLVWGLGLHPLPAAARVKQEGDWRSPAGAFRIGGVWGYDAAIRRHPRLFYHRITPRDLWIEDPASPSYNRHVVLDHDPSTPWERKQQMRQHDHAHSLKLFIAHNAPPNVAPGRGSSIFFHIWRAAGAKPTAGCTTLPEPALRDLIAWLDPSRQPLYVLLPTPEYHRLRQEWSLP